MRVQGFILGLLLCLATPAIAAEPILPQQFLSATRVADAYEFAAPAIIDWAQLAPAALVKPPLKELSPELLERIAKERNMFGHAEIDFSAPLPQNLRDSAFYLVSETGVQPLQALRLNGTVRFRLNDRDRPVSRSLFGVVVARTTDGAAQPPAGLVATFAAPQAVELLPRQPDPKSLVPAEVQAEWQTLPDDARRFWSLQRAFAVRFADQAPFLFVQWTADTACYEACCATRYGIYTDEPQPRLIAGYSGQCDI